jgi:hypothetical protein
LLVGTVAPRSQVSLLLHGSGQGGERRGEESFLRASTAGRCCGCRAWPAYACVISSEPSPEPQFPQLYVRPGVVIDRLGMLGVSLPRQSWGLQWSVYCPHPGLQCGCCVWEACCTETPRLSRDSCPPLGSHHCCDHRPECAQVVHGFCTEVLSGAGVCRASVVGPLGGCQQAVALKLNQLGSCAGQLSGPLCTCHSCGIGATRPFIAWN